MFIINRGELIIPYCANENVLSVQGRKKKMELESDFRSVEGAKRKNLQYLQQAGQKQHERHLFKRN